MLGPSGDAGSAKLGADAFPSSGRGCPGNKKEGDLPWDASSGVPQLPGGSGGRSLVLRALRVWTHLEQGERTGPRAERGAHCLQRPTRGGQGRTLPFNRCFRGSRLRPHLLSGEDVASLSPRLSTTDRELSVQGTDWPWEEESVLPSFSSRCLNRLRQLRILFQYVQDTRHLRAFVLYARAELDDSFPCFWNSC